VKKVSKIILLIISLCIANVNGVVSSDVLTTGVVKPQSEIGQDIVTIPTTSISTISVSSNVIV